MGKQSPKKSTPQQKTEAAKSNAQKKEAGDAQKKGVDIQEKRTDKHVQLKEVFDSNSITKTDPELRITETVSSDGKKYSCIISPALDSKSKYGKVLLELATMLESQHYVSEYDKALATYNILEFHITDDKWKTTQELVDILLNFNKEISARFPDETTPENVIRRMRKIIVDEYITHAKLKHECHLAEQILRTLSIRNFIVEDIPELSNNCDPEEVANKMRKPLIVAMKEYKTELDNCPQVFAKVADNYVSEGDNIYTFSFCPNICAMLKAQAERGFNLNLFIAETAPFSYAYLYADELEEFPNCTITIVHDACLDQIVSKINRVLLPCTALATEVVKTITTGHNFTLFTKNLDIVLVAGTYQLTRSENVMNNKLFNCNGTDCFKYDILNKFLKNVRVILTNTGTIAVSQIGKAITDLYAPKKEKEEAYVIERFRSKKGSPVSTE